MNASFDFKGQVAVITGGTSGIGLDIAKHFAAAGAKVAICCPFENEIQPTVADLKAIAADEVLGLVADVSNRGSMAAFFTEVENKLGPVDILVNGAGIQAPKPALEITEDDWDRVMGINLKGHFFNSQYVAKSMIARGKGNIISISSMQAKTVAEKQLVYGLSKAGISQMTRILAREWASAGIRVNAVGPGSVPTALNREMYKNPETLKRTLSLIPMGRRAEPEEISNVVMFLASDLASYITGQTVYVDGGWMLV